MSSPLSCGAVTIGRVELPTTGNPNNALPDEEPSSPPPSLWPAPSPALAADITGAGATFPYPIYAKWAEAYKAKTGVGINYQSIGSGGGIKQIKAKTVDFGASDMPLKPDELDKDGLLQFPTVIGGVVPVVNLEGVKPGELKLDRHGAGRHLPGQDHQVERPGDRRAQPRRQAARTRRSRWCTAPTARAPPSSSPTTCRRSARSGRTKVGEGTSVEVAGGRRRQGQ